VIGLPCQKSVKRLEEGLLEEGGSLTVVAVVS